MPEYDPDNDYAPDDDEPDQQQQPQRREPNWRRKLEEEARAGREAKAEAEKAMAEATAARRELAFAKAGIDVESGPGKLFARAYDGDATPEAVKAAALEYGIIKPDVTPEEVAAEQRVAAAASGGIPSGTTLDPIAELDAIAELTPTGWNAEGPEQVKAWARANGLTITDDSAHLGQWSTPGAATSPIA